MKRTRKPDSDLKEILDKHELWVRSRFRKGQRADLIGRDLSGVDLGDRNLSGARLRNANLRGARLVDTIFHGANLDGADLAEAVMFDTVFRRVDLSSVRGLESVVHHGPSTVGIDTLLRSKGKIPPVFLEGTGCVRDSLRPLIDWAAKYGERYRFDSVFISYGGPDAGFATLLRNELILAGVVTFFFPKDAAFGERLHRTMRKGINEFDRVILVCSRHSLDRGGVLNEIEETLARESREGGRQLLIPVRLDRYVLSNWSPDRPDLATAVKDRVIADFEGCTKRGAKFRTQIKRLLEVLRCS